MQKEVNMSLPSLPNATVFSDMRETRKKKLRLTVAKRTQLESIVDVDNWKETDKKRKPNCEGCVSMETSVSMFPAKCTECSEWHKVVIMPIQKLLEMRSTLYNPRMVHKLLSAVIEYVGDPKRQNLDNIVKIAETMLSKAEKVSTVYGVQLEMGFQGLMEERKKIVRKLRKQEEEMNGKKHS